MASPHDPDGPAAETPETTPPAEPAEPLGSTWPPHVPHREIDALIDRLQTGQTVDRGEAYQLLRMVAKEAERLRSMSLRLSTAKLAAAEREARSIVSEALGQAEQLRTVGLSVLNNRIDESDRLLSTLREAFRVELRAADLGDAADQRWRRHAHPPEDGDPL